MQRRKKKCVRAHERVRVLVCVAELRTPLTLIQDDPDFRDLHSLSHSWYSNLFLSLPLCPPPSIYLSELAAKCKKNTRVASICERVQAERAVACFHLSVACIVFLSQKSKEAVGCSETRKQRGIKTRGWLSARDPHLRYTTNPPLSDGGWYTLGLTRFGLSTPFSPTTHCWQTRSVC